MREEGSIDATTRIKGSFPGFLSRVRGRICSSFGQTRHLAAATLSIYLYRGSYMPETASRPYRNSLRARCRRRVMRCIACSRGHACFSRDPASLCTIFARALEILGIENGEEGISLRLDGPGEPEEPEGPREIRATWGAQKT